MAGQIRRLFPQAFAAYANKYETQGWKLGDVQMVTIGQRIIANCATQKGYGYTNGQTVFADYPAISAVFTTLAAYSEGNKVGVALPRIGAGLAGGDWEIIHELLKDADAKHPDAELEVYSL